MTATDLAAERTTAAWAGVARVWGLLAAAAYLVATVAILLQMASGPGPDYVDGPDQLRSEADYFAALFANSEGLATATVVSAAAMAVAFLALLPLYSAGIALTCSRGPALRLALLFAVPAAALVVGYAAMSVVPASYWSSGWEQVAPEVVVAIGRDLALLDTVAQATFSGAFAATALSLAHLAWACRTEDGLPSGLAPVCALGAGALAAMIAMDLLDVGSAAVSVALVGATGGIVAPLVAGVLGLRLGAAD